MCAGAAALAALLATMFTGPIWRVIVVALAVVAAIAFGGDVLEQEAAGPGAQRVVHVLVQVEGG